jgi:hypothetical protein
MISWSPTTAAILGKFAHNSKYCRNFNTASLLRENFDSISGWAINSNDDDIHDLEPVPAYWQ